MGDIHDKIMALQGPKGENRDFINGYKAARRDAAEIAASETDLGSWLADICSALGVATLPPRATPADMAREAYANILSKKMAGVQLQKAIGDYLRASS